MRPGITGSAPALGVAGRGDRVAVPAPCDGLPGGAWSATVGVVVCGPGVGAPVGGPTVGVPVGVPPCGVGPGPGVPFGGAGADVWVGPGEPGCALRLRAPAPGLVPGALWCAVLPGAAMS